ncbi:sensor histidine kinase [Actinocorallia libanotica]|uniref:histidine kinase n=1 Tax=Actinocorallia libanotica TaxID=46162 RepID=A0ABN1QJG8_9ACTN
MNGTDRVNGVDVGLAVVFALGIAFTAYSLSVSWGGVSWLFNGVVGAVVCGLALLRRRWREKAAFAGLAVTAAAIGTAHFTDLPQEPGPITVLALAVLTGTVVRISPPRQACAVAAGGALVAAGTWLWASAAVPVWTTAGWACAVAFGWSRRYLADRARATAEKVRQDERLELARELHDIVAHHLTGILLQAQAAQLVARRDPERAAGALAGIEAAGSEALNAMRRTVGLLRDTGDAPPTSPGPERLSTLVERFNRQGPPARLTEPDDTDDWPQEVSSTVYRIVQEALTNVARHAPQARSVTVEVGRACEEITIEVTDDASPRPSRSRQRSGYGLIGMRERVERLGGTLEAGPLPDAGWSVRAALPLSSEHPE